MVAEEVVVVDVVAAVAHGWGVGECRGRLPRLAALLRLAAAAHARLRDPALASVAPRPAPVPALAPSLVPAPVRGREPEPALDPGQEPALDPAPARSRGRGQDLAVARLPAT